MRPILTLACALASLVPTMLPSGAGAAQTSTAPSTQLAGLWQATRRFGPDARGPLILTREADGYVADFGGRRVAVRVAGASLAFDLPNDQGGFRGRLDRASGRIFGHWIRPATIVNFSRYASPVRLLPDGRGRWRGTVAPLEDRFTMFLLARPRADGSLAVLLRNPERDLGTQIGAERIVVEGEAVHLLGRRPGQPERELARGRFDSDSERFTLYFPTRGGTYDFTRAGAASDFYPRGEQPEPYHYRPRPPSATAGPPHVSIPRRLCRRRSKRLSRRASRHRWIPPTPYSFTPC